MESVESCLLAMLTISFQSLRWRAMSALAVLHVVGSGEECIASKLATSSALFRSLQGNIDEEQLT